MTWLKKKQETQTGTVADDGEGNGSPFTGKQEVKNWYTDRHEMVTLQRNWLAVLATLLVAGILVSALFMWMLTPLKSVEPFVIRVDERTGHTEVVDPLGSADLMANEALKRYFLWQYIRAREAYNIYELNHFNELVRVMSIPNEYWTYQNYIKNSNPKSPINTIKDKGKIEPELISMSFPDKTNRAHVRIRVRRSFHGAQPEAVRTKFLYITFSYVKLRLRLRDRYLNPLGFLVRSYREERDLTQQ